MYLNHVPQPTVKNRPFFTVFFLLFLSSIIAPLIKTSVFIAHVLND
nr:MAG TPA: hypothetical protein [Caudoviricetes sp.]